MERATEKYNKHLLATTDVMLFFLGEMTYDAQWYPRLNIYLNSNARIETLERLQSRRHFEKLSVLFQVSTPQELQQKIINISYDSVDGRGRFRRFPRFDQSIEPSNIAVIN